MQVAIPHFHINQVGLTENVPRLGVTGAHQFAMGFQLDPLVYWPRGQRSNGGRSSGYLVNSGQNRSSFQGSALLL